MKFICPLLIVRDINISRKFYENVLSQKIQFDFGENIFFKGGFALQTKNSWINFINKNTSDILENPNNMELYFEEEDFDGFVKKLKEVKTINFVHDIKEHSWGQRVIHFYDPDMHIIEVGESMVYVVRRFLKQGMTIEEASQRSQHPIEFVIKCAVSGENEND